MSEPALTIVPLLQNKGANAKCSTTGPATATPIAVSFHSDGNSVTGKGYCMAVQLTKNPCP